MLSAMIPAVDDSTGASAKLAAGVFHSHLMTSTLVAVISV